MKQQSVPIEKRALQAASLIGFAICVAVAVWGWRTGVLTSQEKLQELVAKWGFAGALLFTVFQAVQVVVPVLPGGLGCLVGVVLFGPIWGFTYNYVGICIGSLLAFAVAKNCGRPLLYCCSPRRPLKNTTPGPKSGTASPSFSSGPSSCPSPRTTSSATWRAPPP